MVLAWGSQSMTRVRCSEAAREAPRLTAVVVLPTPPFWLTMEITRAKFCQVLCEADFSKEKTKDARCFTWNVANFCGIRGFQA